MKHGNCWPFKFHASKYNTVTFYHFWRLYISVDAPWPVKPEEIEYHAGVCLAKEGKPLPDDASGSARRGWAAYHFIASTLSERRRQDQEPDI